MFRMTPNIIENLFTTKSTRLYPMMERKPFERVRGEIFNVAEECTFCTICAVKCPSQCIKVDRKKATWVYDPFACVYCGVCVESCPSKSLRQKEKYRPAKLVREIVSLQGEIKKKAQEPS
ncbi:MAG: 4Fe-4S binding protein [Deltaproteobacteria bacterium]|nr:4Fe-4S binding protein [Deltaproteobacteria bacterium]